jgi:cation transport ATPase
MESRLIHSILDSLPGVQSVDVMVVTKLVSVRHDPAAISPAALVAALNSAGLQASLNKHGTTGGDGHQHCSGCGCCGPADAGSSPQAAWQRRLPWLAGVVRALQGSGGASVPPLLVLGSGLLLVVNLLLLLPGLPTPPLLRKGLLALIAACIGVVPVLRKAWVGLKNKNLDMNCLVSSLGFWRSVSGGGCRGVVVAGLATVDRADHLLLPACCRLLWPCLAPSAWGISLRPARWWCSSLWRSGSRSAA